MDFKRLASHSFIRLTSFLSHFLEFPTSYLLERQRTHKHAVYTETKFMSLLLWLYNCLGCCIKAKDISKRFTFSFMLFVLLLSFLFSLSPYFQQNNTPCASRLAKETYFLL